MMPFLALLRLEVKNGRSTTIRQIKRTNSAGDCSRGLSFSRPPLAAEHNKQSPDLTQGAAQGTEAPRHRGR